MSRIIKKEEAAGLPSLEFSEEQGPLPRGVQPFEVRQVRPTSSFAEDSRRRPEAQARSAAASPSGATSQPDIEEARRQAFQEGFAEGERAAAKRAAEHFQEAIEAFGRTVESLTALKPRIQAEAEQELVALAFAVARRIIRRELTVNPQTVLAIVRACLEEFRRVEVHQLRVNPQDMEPVRGYFESHPAAQLEIVADPSVSRGGGVFETSQGRLDARIETQLSEIEYGLADG